MFRQKQTPLEGAGFNLPSCFVYYAVETDWLAGAAGFEPLHQEFVSLWLHCCRALRSVADGARACCGSGARSGCHSQQAASMPRGPRPARVTMLDDGVGPLASKMSSTTSDRRAKFSRTTEHDS